MRYLRNDDDDVAACLMNVQFFLVLTRREWTEDAVLEIFSSVSVDRFPPSVDSPARPSSNWRNYAERFSFLLCNGFSVDALEVY